MGRYYFHIKAARGLIEDPDGDELPDDEAAILGAIKDTVRDIVQHPRLYGGLRRWARREFVVTDESGQTVMTVPVATLLGHQ